MPLEIINKELKDDPDYEDYQQWGNNILTTAVFSILITAPIGLLVISNLGDKWLSYDGSKEVMLSSQDEDEHSGSHSSSADGLQLSPEV